MRKKIQYLYNSRKIKHILFHYDNITTINANTTNITNTIKATINTTTNNITNATPTIRIVS